MVLQRSVLEWPSEIGRAKWLVVNSIQKQSGSERSSSGATAVALLVDPRLRVRDGVRACPRAELRAGERDVTVLHAIGRNVAINAPRVAEDDGVSAVAVVGDADDDVRVPADQLAIRRLV